MIQKKSEKKSEKKSLLLRVPELVQRKLNLIAAQEVLDNGGKRVSATGLAEELVVRFAESQFNKLVQDGKLSEDMLNG